MKWKDEREAILDRLDDLERRVAALESSDEPTTDRDTELEAAWSAVMSGDSGIQVAIVKPTDPRYDGGPFAVEDNKESVKGEGDSVAEAFAAYVENGGRRHGDSAPLDDFEYQQAEFFATPDNVAAPSSCRHGDQGYFCDFFRTGVTPGDGDKVGPFETPGKAVEALRAELGPNV